MTGKSFSVWLNNEYIPDNPEKVRPNKSRDNHRVNEDGPKQTRNNKWNNQNQVRNQT